MKRNTILFALVLASGISFAQEGADVFKITPATPMVGESHSWFFDVKFQALGQDATFVGTLKRKLLKVDDNGDTTWESQMADAKVHIMGSDMDQPSEPSTAVYDKSGKPKGERKGANDLEEILSAMASVKIPAEGVAKDKVFQLDTTGYYKGKSECKIVGVEQYQGHECIKLDVNYTVASGEGSASGPVYLDKNTGILVGYDVKFSKVTVAAGIVTDGVATTKLLDPK